MDGINLSNLKEIKDFELIYAKDLGASLMSECNGLGAVAIKLKRNEGLKDLVILGFRGSEFDDDFLNDVATNISANLLSVVSGKYSIQADNALKIYKELREKYPNADFYLASPH